MTSRECETCIKRKTVYCPNSIECMATNYKPYYQNRIMLLEENQELKKQNDSLKQKLNWIAFGDDSELALRYLRKIGYVDFDEERKVYINKHNNEPFLLKNEQEKDYYIKDNELNEYTEQLEYQIKELKKKLKDKTEDYRRMKDNFDSKVDVLTKIATQQKEFIKYLEDNWKQTQDIWYIKILQKYKEIIGDDK